MKWPESYAVPDQSAATTVECPVNKMFCRFGAPEELHRDQGQHFETGVFSEVFWWMGNQKDSDNTVASVQ